jgi:hypothetical protein
MKIALKGSKTLFQKKGSLKEGKGTYVLKKKISHDLYTVER